VYALENIRVVELGGYIVGSFCATLLADMGADVIKIEALTGDGLRGQLGAFQGWNRGKRGMSIDLYKDEGKVILHKLVQKADVLVQNLRHGVAERWGADYATLSNMNPRLVYLAMPGYGQSGPYIDKPAFDPLIQAMSGAMTAQGGKGNPPVYLRSAICDYAGAILGAWGVAMALYARAKTGKGQFLHGALINAAISIQAGEFIDYSGKREPARLEGSGRNALYRLYQAQDGWFFIGAKTEAHWKALCNVLNRPELLADSRFNTSRKRTENMVVLSSVLELLFIELPSQYWLDLLDRAGIPCSKVNYLRDLFEHPQVLENDLVAEHESADVGAVKQLGKHTNLSETPGKLWRAAPGLGQHNNEILAGLGYTQSEIETLREKGVIK